MGVIRILKWFKRIFFIVLAVAILAVSINWFLAPHHVAAGGLTGLAIILEGAIGWNRSLVVLVLNIFIVVLTYFTLGKKMFINTVIGALLLPAFMAFIPNINLVTDMLLSVIIGSALFGVGVAILYNNDASSGGTSIPPLIFQKYFGLNPSIGLLVTDSIVVLISIFVFGIEAFFFAIFSIFITAMTMKYLESGANMKKTVMIISDEKEAILKDVLSRLQRGTSIIPIRGGYSQKEREMLMVTLYQRDYKKLIDLIDEHDKKAFIISFNVADVHGSGFTYDSGSI